MAKCNVCNKQKKSIDLYKCYNLNCCSTFCFDCCEAEEDEEFNLNIKCPDCGKILDYLEE